MIDAGPPALGSIQAGPEIPTQPFGVVGRSVVGGRITW